MSVLDKARSFYRSEAFAEDVADLIEPAPRIVPTPVRARHLSMLWPLGLLGLLPLAALAVGVTWII